jgi:hypothetical protein
MTRAPRSPRPALPGPGVLFVLGPTARRGEHPQATAGVHWDRFLAKRAEIHDAQQRIRNEASVTQQDDDLEWCRAQLLDHVASWDAADDDQRSRLLSALFESIDAEALPRRGLRLVATPRDAWRRFSSRWYWTEGDGAQRRVAPGPATAAMTRPDWLASNWFMRSETSASTWQVSAA